MFILVMASNGVAMCYNSLHSVAFLQKGKEQSGSGGGGGKCYRSVLELCQNYIPSQHTHTHTHTHNTLPLSIKFTL